jgi:hypothetical protein
MLGIEDPMVATAYILCIVSALLCLVWGIIKWNTDDPEIEPEAEVRQWAEEEERVEKEL